MSNDCTKCRAFKVMKKFYKEFDHDTNCPVYAVSADDDSCTCWKKEAKQYIDFAKHQKKLKKRLDK